ncbi:hypothetical protein [Pseudarthrobacter sp. NamE2]|uniref:hypothetical protein n=1 Tax=Pseudarthrobacter sp. NamE2 TaxID=2576838 RepID=UPI001484D1BD|nr:hypothetical protein [Pseudarthrobacter sp. NamE2]
MTSTPRLLPKWALQRVAAYLEHHEKSRDGQPDPLQLAQRTGLSKSLARQCLRELQHHP